MKKLLSILPIFIFFVSCGQNSSNDSDLSSERRKGNQIKVCNYSPSTIPAFIKALLKNHNKDYLGIDSVYYVSFCEKNNLVITDSTNIKKYYSIKILHDLFTSQAASNCSKGEILNIPYQWHWVSPNPRHTIRSTENGKLLTEIKPPAEFSKYKSCADIDRTPYLFLSDLFSAKPKYYSASCDTFPAFGWCSEREMAFVNLLEILNYTGKVVADGNHSWSEFIVPMKSIDGKQKKFSVAVDNTFNGLSWTPIEDNKIEVWKKSFGDSPMANWYNQKAHNANDRKRVSEFVISKEVMDKVEINLVNYLKKIR